MIVIGVTGGIGMGKSAAGGLLAKLGVDSIDTDTLARQVCAVGETAYREILLRFEDKLIVSVDGSIDRARLANIVFNDPQSLKDLEEILHPRIRAAWEKWLNQRRQERKAAAAVLIPLLFEKAYEPQFTATIAMGCAEKTQERRLLARGWDLAQIKVRNAAQLPADEKLRRAKYVVWTEGSLATHERQWVAILESLGVTCCRA